MASNFPLIATQTRVFCDSVTALSSITTFLRWKKQNILLNYCVLCAQHKLIGSILLGFWVGLSFIHPSEYLRGGLVDFSSLYSLLSFSFIMPMKRKGLQRYPVRPKHLSFRTTYNLHIDASNPDCNGQQGTSVNKIMKLASKNSKSIVLPCPIQVFVTCGYQTHKGDTQVI